MHPSQEVALLAEGVDRNLPGQSFIGINVKVALLAEGVDRNLPGQSFIGINVKVALLAEGVDRNKCPCGCSRQMVGRPPSGGRG